MPEQQIDPMGWATGLYKAHAITEENYLNNGRTLCGLRTDGLEIEDWFPDATAVPGVKCKRCAAILKRRPRAVS